MVSIRTRKTPPFAPPPGCRASSMRFNCSATSDAHAFTMPAARSASRIASSSPLRSFLRIFVMLRTYFSSSRREVVISRSSRRSAALR